MHKITAVCLIYVAVAGCAGGALPHMEIDDNERQYLNYAGQPVSKFTAMSGIKSWEAVSDDRLILKTGVNKAYIVKVWTCPGLRFAKSIAVVSSIGNSVRVNDKIQADDSTCPIREIRQLDVRQMKADKKTMKHQRQY